MEHTRKRDQHEPSTLVGKNTEVYNKHISEGSVAQTDFGAR